MVDMSPSQFVSENPASPPDIVGKFDATTREDAAGAVERAAAAQRGWAAASPGERATVIGAIAHALARRTHDLVELISREEGKTIAQAHTEVRKAGEQFHFASQLSYLAEGATYPDEETGTFAFTRRVPLGVVVAITPWNFPLSLPARKLAPALAVGNAVVFKPSPATAAVSDLIVQTCVDAGLPNGLIQVAHGAQPESMKALVGHPQVRAITFTGSDRVGAVLRRAGHDHARLQSEMGGHNAAVICADADLPRAARDIAIAAFGLTGQACTATDRILVEQSVSDRFSELLATETTALVAGPGNEPGTSCGPVATKAQHTRLQELFASAVDGGARVLAKGRIADNVNPDGYWVAPTLFTDVPPSHDLVTREIFGPAGVVIPVADVDTAVSIINSSDHGLVCSIHTSDLSTSQRFAQEVTCGIVKVNDKTTGNGIAPPFGGWKSSSAGAFPEGGRQAIDFFTDTKTVYLKYS